ncbi:MAG: protein kinase [Solirubrobacterales bacterium]|nr:protein kinase [Solirubrobacterales bacterium]
MSRSEQTPMTDEARRELEAIDATLGGEAVAAEHLPLAELALATQALRPRPSEEFVQALDARAARGFSGERREAPGESSSARRSSSRPGGGTRRKRLRTAAPALGLGLAALIAVAVAVSLSGSGRGRVAQPAFRSAPAAPRGPLVSAPAAGTAGPGVAAPAGSPGATRQVERTSTLDIGVAQDSIQSAAQRVFTMASAFGGYVKQSNVSSGGPLQGGASFDIRLPSSKLPSAIAALSHLGHVRSENDTTNDVTDQLSSLRRSLGGLEAERSSLLRQLAAASEAQQAARLKARLHAVEARISQLQGTLRALTARIDYTSLALTLTPESSGGAASGELTPGAAAGDAARILDAALAVLVIGAAAVLPLAVIVIAGWTAVALTRRRLREQALDAS